MIWLVPMSSAKINHEGRSLVFVTNDLFPLYPYNILIVADVMTLGLVSAGLQSS